MRFVEIIFEIVEIYYTIANVVLLNAGACARASTYQCETIYVRAHAHATAQRAFVLFSFDLLPFVTKRNKIKRTRLFLKVCGNKEKLKAHNFNFDFQFFFHFNSAASNKQE